MAGGRSSSPPMDPLILTLALDSNLHARLTRLRRAHFPPERNFLDAHLTLFHALHGDHFADITETLTCAARSRPMRPVRVTDVMDIGSGVAFRVEVEGLAALHKSLQFRFDPWLTAQDRQGLRPHVTIQNKVSRDRAMATLEQIRGTFTPFEGLATGLDLWHYRGGPWDHAATFPFEDDR